ncbi:unnamed protein product [Choristocarpus tenellus]
MAEWWTELSVSRDSYVPPIYSEGSTVSTNHAILLGLRERDYDVSDQVYMYGLITTLGVFIFAGLVGCLLCPCLCFGSGTYRVNERKRMPVESESQGRRWKWPTLMVCASVLAAVIAAMAGAIVSDDAISGVATSAHQAANDLREAIDMSESASISLANSQAAHESLLRNVNESCDLAGDRSYTLIRNSGSFFADMGGFLNATGNSSMEILSSDLEKLSDFVSSTAGIRRGTVIPVLIVASFAIVAFAVMGWGHFKLMEQGDLKSTNWWLRYVMWPWGFLVASMTWILAGAAVSFSALTGDFCVNPSENLYNQLDKQDLLLYYSEECSGENQVVEAIQDAEYLAVNQLDDLVPAINEVGESCQAVSEEALGLVGSLYNLWVQIQAHMDLTSCRNLNGQYNNGVTENMCGKLGSGLMLLWVCLVIVSVLLVALLWLWSFTVARKSIQATKGDLEMGEEEVRFQERDPLPLLPTDNNTPELLLAPSPASGLVLTANSPASMVGREGITPSLRAISPFMGWSLTPKRSASFDLGTASMYTLPKSSTDRPRLGSAEVFPASMPVNGGRNEGGNRQFQPEVKRQASEGCMPKGSWRPPTPRISTRIDTDGNAKSVGGLPKHGTGGVAQVGSKNPFAVGSEALPRGKGDCVKDKSGDLEGICSVSSCKGVGSAPTPKGVGSVCSSRDSGTESTSKGILKVSSFEGVERTLSIKGSGSISPSNSVKNDSSVNVKNGIDSDTHKKIDQSLVNTGTPRPNKMAQLPFPGGTPAWVSVDGEGVGGEQGESPPRSCDPEAPLRLSPNRPRDPHKAMRLHPDTIAQAEATSSDDEEIAVVKTGDGSGNACAEVVVTSRKLQQRQHQQLLSSNERPSSLRKRSFRAGGLAAGGSVKHEKGKAGGDLDQTVYSGSTRSGQTRTRSVMGMPKVSRMQGCSDEEDVEQEAPRLKEGTPKEGTPKSSSARTGKDDAGKKKAMTPPPPLPPRLGKRTQSDDQVGATNSLTPRPTSTVRSKSDKSLGAGRAATGTRSSMMDIPEAPIERAPSPPSKQSSPAPLSSPRKIGPSTLKGTGFKSMSYNISNSKAAVGSGGGQKKLERTNRTQTSSSRLMNSRLITKTSVVGPRSPESIDGSVKGSVKGVRGKPALNRSISVSDSKAVPQSGEGRRKLKQSERSQSSTIHTRSLTDSSVGCRRRSPEPIDRHVDEVGGISALNRSVSHSKAAARSGEGRRKLERSDRTQSSSSTTLANTRVRGRRSPEPIDGPIDEIGGMNTSLR